MENIILTPVTVENLVEKIALKVIELLNNQSKQKLTEPENDLLTRDEACKLLCINKTTLWKHTNSGLLVASNIGARVFYSRKQVLEVIKPKR